MANIRKWDPFGEIFSLRDEIDRLFEDYFGKTSDRRDESFWYPAMDISETEEGYLVEMDVPGIPKENIKISVKDNQLTITGERKSEKKEEDKDRTYHRIERYYGKFQRTIALPNEIDIEKIKADYKDGVLKITLPRSEKSKPKEIKIDIK